MAGHPPPERLALVVHPTRPLGATLATLERWAEQHEIGVVQLQADPASDREVAPPGELEGCDLIVALGGDGTVLAALHAAASLGAPVLGVACGSLGALAAVTADQLEAALDRVGDGDWTERRLPALSVQPADGPELWAVNDFVAVRRNAGQLVADVSVDDELYARLAGDGLIVATPIGSSAYSMAAGGPLLSAGTAGFVCTPVAMHGGNAPPLIVPASSTVRVLLHPSFAGYEIEIDGRSHALEAIDYRLSLHEDKGTLVSLGAHDGRGLTALRARRLITDSPRVLARDDRLAPQPVGPGESLG